jgi:hypothetical protein
MIHQEEKILILKFLEKNYPTNRIKDKTRFKRSIVLDDGVYFLGDKEMTKKLYYKLLDILAVVFGGKRELNEDVLKIFLHLK